MRTVAVVGASRNSQKFGNKAVRAFLKRGFKVVPINPQCATMLETVEGLATYASVLDAPGEIDIATLYIPPEIGMLLLDEFVQKKIQEIWVNPGADSQALGLRASTLGLRTIFQCSIVAIGESPADYA